MKEYDRVIYNKNPLDNVVLQLKFTPILLIDSNEPVEFQNEIRHKFPYYVPSSSSLAINGQLQIARKNYKFSEDNDASKKYHTINLDRETLSLSTTKYENWEKFLGLFQNALTPFEKCYTPNFYTRIGLRYTDIISKKTLGLENLSWKELIDEKYLGFLSGDFEKNIIANKNQYIIKLDDTMNYMVNIFTGIIKHIDTGENCFSIDSDFSLVGKIEPNMVIDHIKKLHKYSRPIFRSIITDKLHNYMEPEKYGQ